MPALEHEKLQATAGLVIAPSEVEGFGHYINESRAYGSIVITTDYSPMNELIHPSYGFLVKSIIVKTKSWSKAPVVEVDEKNLELAVKNILNLSLERKKEMSLLAKKSFSKDKDDFLKNLKNIFLDKNLKI